MKTATTASLPAPASPTPANDNLKPAGTHEWPALDRLRAGTLMRTPAGNNAGRDVIVRLRADIRAAEPASIESATFGSDAAIGEDVRDGFASHLKVERVTAEHLIALEASGALEYRLAPDGWQVLPFKRDGEQAYQLEDRYRGELGPAANDNTPDVQDELNSRYGGAVWPSAPGAAIRAHDLFSGAKIRCGPPPRTWTANDGRMVEQMFARRRLAFIEGAVAKPVMVVLRQMVDGETSVSIGETRGHKGKYASAVGTELQRLAIQCLLDAYSDFDGCHPNPSRSLYLMKGFFCL